MDEGITCTCINNDFPSPGSDSNGYHKLLQYSNQLIWGIKSSGVFSSKIESDHVADTVLLEGVVGWRGGPPDFKLWKERLLLVGRYCTDGWLDGAGIK